MDTIIYLLVLGAVYLVVYVVKSLSSTAGSEGRKVFTESFPTIEILETEKSERVPRSVVTPPEYSFKEPLPQKSSERAKPAAAQAAEKSAAACGKGERLVRLNNKSEAKRAFLYSEIFNRKFD